MTRAEYLKDKIDHCTRQATICKKINDIEGVKFYQNAKIGFEKKLNGLTIEQCEEVING